MSQKLIPMKTLISSWLLLSSALALVLSIVVFSHAADTPANTRPAMRGPHALGPFTLFDTNHDGVLSTEEIAAAPDALAKLDKNSDGQLTPDELHPAHCPPPLPGESGPEGDMPPPPEL